MNRFCLLGVLAVSVTLVGCSNQAAAPSAPSSLVSPVAIQGPLDSSASTSGTHGLALTPLLGVGSGIVNVTPTAAVDGSFSAQIVVNVHGAPPNARFYVQRAPEVGRPQNADGICQRAAGEAPWGPPTANFVTFPRPAAGPLVVLQTSEGGAGSVHIDFAAPMIADGTAFDVMFRLVDDLTSPSNELRTGCFTVRVK